MTGRVSLPTDSKLRLADLTVDAEMSPDPPSIDTFGDSTYRDNQWAAYGEFIKSELGKAYQRKNIAVNADGTFRIEGLPETRYVLYILAYEKPVRPGGDRRPLIAQTARRVEVPPITESREPVDLGKLVLDVYITKGRQSNSDQSRQQGGRSPQLRLRPVSDFPLKPSDRLKTLPAANRVAISPAADRRDLVRSILTRRLSSPLRRPWEKLPRTAAKEASSNTLAAGRSLV